MRHGSFWHLDPPDDYYIWLGEMINTRAHSGYSKLVSFLFDTEFYWLVANDVNRAEDGKQLRFDYIFENNIRDDAWVDEPCSVLEMLIALAGRVRVDIMPDFDLEIEDWFWQFVKNLGLDEFDDRHFCEVEIRQKIDDFLERTGKNDLFKLGVKNFRRGEKKAPQKVEIWYQLHAWLAENYNF